MPRATGPESPMGLIRDIPKPKFAVGDMVIWGGRDRKYTQKVFLRHLIRKWRRVIGRHRKMSDGNAANIIREAMQVVREAKIAQIAGIQCNNACVDYPGMNACYVAGVHGASAPAYFTYQLLFTWEKDGNTLALITGAAIGCEEDLKLVTSQLVQCVNDVQRVRLSK